MSFIKEIFSHNVLYEATVWEDFLNALYLYIHYFYSSYLQGPVSSLTPDYIWALGGKGACSRVQQEQPSRGSNWGHPGQQSNALTTKPPLPS